MLDCRLVRESGVIFSAKAPLLSSYQLSRLSNIMDNAGQVTLATMVLGPLFAGGLDKTNPLVLISGLVATLSLWIGSLWFAREGEPL